MKRQLLALALWMLPIHAGLSSGLAEKVWNHGSEDCASNRDPAIEVFAADPSSYVLRQSKCVHFEAPFLYVLFGTHTVFVLDTGATGDPERFPIYDTVLDLVARRNLPALKILVAHSHSHGDHTAADSQFRGKPGVSLIEPEAAAVRGYFGFKDWPTGQATIDLGGRSLTVLPAPGHQDEGIAVYDAQTGWLLSGDSVYPGRLYVKNWNEYRSSIGRLAEFSKSHPISAVLGAHIELSRSGKLFPAGSRFQPGEAPLALRIEDLLELDASLQQQGAKPSDIVLTNLVVTPIGAFQRALGGLLKWLGFR